MNITNAIKNNRGTLIESTGVMSVSQDFQAIQSDRNPAYPPHRIVFNFGESCRSSNTTIDTLRQLSYNSIESTSIIYAEKIALVKRGSCNWSEKMAVVNDLTRAHYLNVTAVFIYDNDTHGGAISIEKTLTTGTGRAGPATYSTDLPPARNILSMPDNDLLTIPSSSSITVFFIPLIYGESFIQKINVSYNPSNPDIRNFTLLTPYFEERSWPPYNESFFSGSRGYLSYIIALAAVFLIGVIFLRWWKIRRMRADYPNGFNGFTTADGFNLQPRVNRLDPLPVDIVNSLPIDKYQEDLVKNENCAICLEDFVPGKNDIRILPCGHGFCVLCIDPWLTQKSTTCPICKWDCLPMDLRRERNEQLERERMTRRNNNSDSHVVQIPTTPSPVLLPNENSSTIPLTTIYAPPSPPPPSSPSSPPSFQVQASPPQTPSHHHVTEKNEPQSSVEANEPSGEPSQPHTLSENKSPPKY
ncbi:hypothetical protein MFLAVUS_005237 [Mucor flavus]|uniref:RING-type domain-containing protein n=1 Tax=Mucor flavus TaxID=439312 RepID=A0ABP9YY61_9FUNG